MNNHLIVVAFGTGIHSDITPYLAPSILPSTNHQQSQAPNGRGCCTFRKDCISQIIKAAIKQDSTVTFTGLYDKTQLCFIEELNI